MPTDRRSLTRAIFLAGAASSVTVGSALQANAADPAYVVKARIKFFTGADDKNKQTWLGIDFYKNMNYQDDKNRVGSVPNGIAGVKFVENQPVGQKDFALTGVPLYYGSDYLDGHPCLLITLRNDGDEFSDDVWRFDIHFKMLFSDNSVGWFTQNGNVLECNHNTTKRTAYDMRPGPSSHANDIDNWTEQGWNINPW